MQRCYAKNIKDNNSYFSLDFIFIYISYVASFVPVGIRQSTVYRAIEKILEHDEKIPQSLDEIKQKAIEYNTAENDYFASNIARAVDELKTDHKTEYFPDAWGKTDRILLKSNRRLPGLVSLLYSDHRIDIVRMPVWTYNKKSRILSEKELREHDVFGYGIWHRIMFYASVCCFCSYIVLVIIGKKSASKKVEDNKTD